MSECNDGLLSVIMPAFNEEAVIQKAIEQTCQTLAGREYEIIVVDDGSSDHTSEKARAVCGNAPVKVVTHYPNSGKGGALRRGFEHASGDLIAFLDADLDLPPQQIWKLYDAMQRTGADVVVGCKHHPQSELAYPWHRRILSAGYYGMVKFLFGLPLRDTQTGIKLFRREVLERVFPRVRVQGFTYDLAILIAASRFGYRIVEVPVRVVYNNQKKAGRIGPRAIMKMWFGTLGIFYEASFWRWLHPAATTKFWMVAFVLGLLAASFGAASALTFLPLPPWISHVGYYLMLKFMPRSARNLLLIVAGTVAVLVSLVQLNKSLMKAFARTDDGGLAGIWKRRRND